MGKEFQSSRSVLLGKLVDAWGELMDRTSANEPEYLGATPAKAPSEKLNSSDPTYTSLRNLWENIEQRHVELSWRLQRSRFKQHCVLRSDPLDYIESIRVHTRSHGTTHPQNSRRGNAVEATNRVTSNVQHTYLHIYPRLRICSFDRHQYHRAASLIRCHRATGHANLTEVPGEASWRL